MFQAEAFFIGTSQGKIRNVRLADGTKEKQISGWAVVDMSQMIVLMSHL